MALTLFIAAFTIIAAFFFGYAVGFESSCRAHHW